jgi:hypothetical protein
MIFTTYSGSRYQINKADKTIRRLNGKADPTTRMNKDGDWRPYVDLFPDPIVVGMSVMIVWGADVPLLPDTILQDGEVALKTTTTSTVVGIDESN